MVEDLKSDDRTCLNWDKRFFMVCLAWGVGLAGYAAYDRCRPRAKIACDSPQLALGEVEPQDEIECNFIIRNEGNSPLSILDVRPGCGACVSVTRFTQAPILPAGKGSVLVCLHGKTITSKQVKGVTVISNDPRTPRYVLKIEAQPRVSSLGQ
jgi:hypothetical protein